MARFSKRLAEDMLEMSGYLPNLWSLELAPGDILRAGTDGYHVVGRLDERATDPAVRASLTAAIDAVRPGPGASESAPRLKVGLKYKSGGATLVAFDGGGGANVGDATVKLDAMISFEDATDYLFDTTQPAVWHTFPSTAIDDVRAVALEVLRAGEVLVTGTVWCQRWLWYVSKTRNSAVGFVFEGQAPGTLAGLDFGSLADASAKAELKMRYSKGECLEGRGEDGVAAFRGLSIHKHPFGKPELEGPRMDSAAGGMVFKLGDGPVSAPGFTQTLGTPTAEDLNRLCEGL